MLHGTEGPNSPVSLIAGSRLHGNPPARTPLPLLVQPAMKKILKDAGFSSVGVLDDWAHPLNTYYIAKP